MFCWLLRVCDIDSYGWHLREWLVLLSIQHEDLPLLERVGQRLTLVLRPGIKNPLACQDVRSNSRQGEWILWRRFLLWSNWNLRRGWTVFRWLKMSINRIHTKNINMSTLSMKKDGGIMPWYFFLWAISGTIWIDRTHRIRTNSNLMYGRWLKFLATYGRSLGE